MYEAYLGFDLGAKCGLATIFQYETGELEVETTLIECHGKVVFPERHMAFYEETVSQLRALSNLGTIVNGIFYEEVKRHMGTAAAHAYGAYKAFLYTACIDAGYDIPTGLHVGTIKKEATGSGNATKEQMICAAHDTFGTPLTLDDNEADAVWIAELGRLSLIYDD